MAVICSRIIIFTKVLIDNATVLIIAVTTVYQELFAVKRLQYFKSCLVSIHSYNLYNFG